MRNTLKLGDLIYCLYEEYIARYGDNELAALAADVALNDLLLQNDVRDLVLERWGDEPSSPVVYSINMN